MSSKIVRVPITTDNDLILTMDFEKKIIEVESNHWTTIAKRKGVESPDQVAATIGKIVTDIDEPNTVKPNKKIQPSLDEKILSQVMHIFDSMAAETKYYDQGGIPSRSLRSVLENKKIVKSYQEFTKFLNMALERDLIEYITDSEHQGLYTRKKRN